MGVASLVLGIIAMFLVCLQRERLVGLVLLLVL